MKKWKLMLSLLAVFALFATACGSDVADGVDNAVGAVEGAADGATDTVDEAVTTEEETMEEETMEEETMEEETMEEETMEEEPEEAMAESTAGQGGTFTMLQWQAPSQANAHLSSGTKDLLAGSIVIEPLASIDPDGNVVPRLVDEVPTLGNGGISEDLTEITWTISEGIVWSDGTPLTSEDLVFTYEYCADELTGCTGDWAVDIDKVVAVDDRTITITFAEPKPYPYTAFVGFTSPVLQAAQFAGCIGEGSASCSDQNFAPIGTGPYMITELRPEDTVSYAMNPNYRGAAEGKPFFSNVTLKGGGDAEASARSVLEIGEADFGWNLQVAPEILAPMEAAGQGRVAVAFATNVEHINLNQTNNRAEGDARSDYLDGTNPHPILFENPELARALSLAIDRDLLVQVGYGATGVPTCNMWNVGTQTSTNNDWCLTRDVDQANDILDGLGFVDTDGDGIREANGLPMEFDFATSTNAVRQSNQAVIEANWEEIGVAVNMKDEDASLFFDGTNAQGLSIWHFFNDMEMFTNSAANPDPAAYLGGWRTSEIPTLESAWGGSNMPRMANADFDAVYEDLAATPLDDPSRDDKAIELNDILSADSGAIIPLILRGSVSAFSADIENTGPLNAWDSEYWNIADWTRG